MKRTYNWTGAARPPHERILARLEKAYGVLDPDECWIWPGAKRGNVPHFYGQITVGSRQDGTRRSASTHTVMYEAFVGPIPDGLEIDHYVAARGLPEIQ